MALCPKQFAEQHAPDGRHWQVLLHLRDTAARVDLLHPSVSRAVSAWMPDTAALSLPTTPSAVLLRIAPTAPGAP
ncbi:hypothetical protein [Streptomyces yerevanensis]|uniref:hypothetical protein n=1 Tax=Streptomyces yerevanensis TaxID=66378 RepID=UPI00052512B0|nr:hypothetical protein [Streptomyces yerevanensis]